MQEIPGMPELPKQPVFTNQWLAAGVYLIGLFFFLLFGYLYISRNKNCDESSSAVGLQIMAKEFVDTKAAYAIQEIHIKKLQDDSARNAAQQWNQNNYLKKKVLNPLKKQYNGN